MSQKLRTERRWPTPAVRRRLSVGFLASQRAGEPRTHRVCIGAGLVENIDHITSNDGREPDPASDLPRRRSVPRWGRDGGGLLYTATCYWSVSAASIIAPGMPMYRHQPSAAGVRTVSWTDQSRGANRRRRGVASSSSIVGVRTRDVRCLARR